MIHLFASHDGTHVINPNVYNTSFFSFSSLMQVPKQEEEK